MACLEMRVDEANETVESISIASSTADFFIGRLGELESSFLPCLRAENASERDLRGGMDPNILDTALWLMLLLHL